MIDKLLPLVRTVAFGAVWLFSIIIFCLSMYIVTGAYYPFSTLPLSISILSLVALPTLYVFIFSSFSNKNRGAITSFVAVEIAWLLILWIFWISSAGSTVTLSSLNYCTRRGCPEARAITAFSFLSWLVITFYAIALLTLSIRSHLRGHTHVWRTEVIYFEWSAPAANNGSNEGGIAGAEKNFTGITVHSENTHQSQHPQVGNVSTVGPRVLQQYPPQQPQYPPPQQQQVFVGAPGRTPQSPQV
ncbi:hypothetical protein EST38_g2838 [Candolleomyces aberdarensis]|uniref:MARVEL domain-containing protein n=1 Tax=Candolleomyces aberdarensis TaxID=2316362 RepID=A0A4Q2DVQ2_9AGAR|nr:hypothetical protein EST38_g2838 [Candolleomyces aberdarensis]